MSATITMDRQADGNLEGAADVMLAPVSGKDERRQLPMSFFERKPGLFVLKFAFANGLVLLGWGAIALVPSVPVVLLAMLINGLIYAHLVELQHECLHGHAFPSPRLNRLFGVLCGIFMMSSYSHYRYDHLRHHAYLGTARNFEHFDYRFQKIGSFLGFAKSFFDLSRYRRVFYLSFLSLLGRPLPKIEKANYQRDIKQEYVFYSLLLAASVAYAVYTGSYLMLLAWWLPAMLVAEGAHFMIEMPEHFGLNTQTDPNVLTNTRTVRTSPLFGWYVNGNDVHTAHHYHQGVPMCNVRKLHETIQDKIAVVETSYMSFFWNVMRGRIQQQIDTTCMTR